MKILVVDDNQDDLDLACYLLRAAGHDVAAEGSGAAALRSIRCARPDIVVTDLRMPGAIDGFQLLRFVRDDPDLLDLRTVAVTATMTTSTSELAVIDAGFDEYVHKPLRAATFAHAVTGALP